MASIPKASFEIKRITSDPKNVDLAIKNYAPVSFFNQALISKKAPNDLIKEGVELVKKVNALSGRLRQNYFDKQVNARDRAQLTAIGATEFDINALKWKEGNANRDYDLATAELKEHLDRITYIYNASADRGVVTEMVNSFYGTPATKNDPATKVEALPNSLNPKNVATILKYPETSKLRQLLLLYQDKKISAAEYEQRFMAATEEDKDLFNPRSPNYLGNPGKALAKPRPAKVPIAKPIPRPAARGVNRGGAIVNRTAVGDSFSLISRGLL